MTEKDIEKKDDLELNDEDAEAVKGGAHAASHAASHAEVHAKVHGAVHKGPSVHKGPEKT